MISKRIEWIDVAKGLTIILVIIGHSIRGVIRGAIFSFHMPLFFILSCMTYKFSTNSDEYIKKIEKAFSHLILSAVGIYFFRTVFNIMKNFRYFYSLSLFGWKQYLADIINVFIFSSGMPVIIGDIQIAAIGIPWFLIVLFLGRALFDYLHLKLDNKRFYVSIAICSVLGVCLGKIQYLPFSFDIVLAIQPLFIFGKWLKEYDMENKALKTFSIYFVVWGILFLFLFNVKDTYFELASRSYTLFPICYICAIAGTMFVSSFSQIALKLKNVCIPIKYLGKNSLIMLWVHCFDFYYKFLYELTDYSFVNGIIRVCVDLIVFALAMWIIEWIKKNKHLLSFGCSCMDKK